MAAAKPKCALCGESKADLWLVKGQPFCYPEHYDEAVAEEVKRATARKVT